MAVAGMCGPPAALQWSSRGPLVCAIIAIMSVAYYAKGAGVGNSPSSELPNAMKQPSRSGQSGAGPLVKKSRTGQGHHRLARRSGLLSVADGRTHLGSTRENTGAAGQADARSSLGD